MPTTPNHFHVAAGYVSLRKTQLSSTQERSSTVNVTKQEQNGHHQFVNKYALTDLLKDDTDGLVLTFFGMLFQSSEPE